MGTNSPIYTKIDANFVHGAAEMDISADYLIKSGLSRSKSDFQTCDLDHFRSVHRYVMVQDVLSPRKSWSDFDRDFLIMVQFALALIDAGF